MTVLLGAYVPRREPLQGVEEHHAQANVRIGEQLYPQAAPDPVRQSEFIGDASGLVGNPHRVSRQQIAVMSQPAGHPHGPQVFGHAMGEESFRVETYGPAPRAQPLTGIQEPVSIRPNIDVPNVAAYGSLFSLQTAPYGLS